MRYEGFDLLSKDVGQQVPSSSSSTSAAAAHNKQQQPGSSMEGDAWGISKLKI